jgi:putative SbcD/Mre11-related phosphoesterase
MSEGPEPLFGERALHLPEARAVVVGDLHVGLESDLRHAGVNIPSQTERMRERLRAIVERTAATRLIVIGDLKHKIPYATRQERSELPYFFRDVGARVELVPGNHDIEFEEHLPDVEVHPAAGIRVEGGVALLHGHTWPADDIMDAATRVVVTCHNHPAVMLVDALGHRHKEAAWVRTRFTAKVRERYPRLPEDATFLVMPAFNELTGGTAFNAPEGEGLLGPLLGTGMVDVEGARLWTVDGVDLGTIRQLRKLGGEERGERKPKMFGRKKRPGWIE